MAKRGRPTLGTSRGRPLTIYLSQPREALFDRAFEQLKRKGKLPSTATPNQSRAEIIDYALDALLAQLEGTS